MAGLSLRQAAEAAGTSKSTILRAIQSGRLSAQRLESGGYAIDPAELFRVYPRKEATEPQRSEERSAGQSATAAAPDETPVLKAKLEAMEREAALLREQARELREQRDAWQRQAEQAQRLLASSTGEAAQSPPATQRRGWLARLFG